MRTLVCLLLLLHLPALAQPDHWRCQEMQLSLPDGSFVTKVSPGSYRAGSWAVSPEVILNERGQSEVAASVGLRLPKFKVSYRATAEGGQFASTRWELAGPFSMVTTHSPSLESGWNNRLGGALKLPSGLNLQTTVMVNDTNRYQTLLTGRFRF